MARRAAGRTPFMSPQRQELIRNTFDALGATASGHLPKERLWPFAQLCGWDTSEDHWAVKYITLCHMYGWYAPKGPDRKRFAVFVDDDKSPCYCTDKDLQVILVKLESRHELLWELFARLNSGDYQGRIGTWAVHRYADYCGLGGNTDGEWLLQYRALCARFGCSPGTGMDVETFGKLIAEPGTLHDEGDAGVVNGSGSGGKESDNVGRMLATGAWSCDPEDLYVLLTDLGCRVVLIVLLFDTLDSERKGRLAPGELWRFARSCDEMSPGAWAETYVALSSDYGWCATNGVGLRAFARMVDDGPRGICYRRSEELWKTLLDVRCRPALIVELFRSLRGQTQSGVLSKEHLAYYREFHVEDEDQRTLSWDVEAGIGLKQFARMLNSSEGGAYSSDDELVFIVRELGSRRHLVSRLFRALGASDEGRGSLTNVQLRHFASLRGFRGNDNDWAAQCRKNPGLADTHVDLIEFEALVAQKGSFLYCSDDDLRSATADLYALGTADTDAGGAALLADAGAVGSEPNSPRHTRHTTRRMTRHKHQLSVGERVDAWLQPQRVPGTVRYVGQHAHLGGFWVGVELDKPKGTIDGAGYFKCTQNRGIMVRKAAITPMTSSADGLSPVRGARSDLERANTRDDDQDENKLPMMLYAMCPNGPEQCAGEYALVRGQTANGEPLWRRVDGDEWLYSSLRGSWMIGGTKEHEADFQCSTGYLFQRKRHNGMPPGSRTDGWWRSNDASTGWIEDPDITVVTVTSPEDMRRRLEMQCVTSVVQARAQEDALTRAYTDVEAMRSSLDRDMHDGHSSSEESSEEEEPKSKEELLFELSDARLALQKSTARSRAQKLQLENGKRRLHDLLLDIEDPDVAACGFCGGVGCGMCKGKGEDAVDKQYRCPSGHLLKVFQTHKDGFNCDACHRKLRKGESLRGCRACNYDVCFECFP